MSDFLTKLASPVVWLGVIAFIMGGILRLMGGQGEVLTVGMTTYLETAKTCFLFAIAAGVLGKARS